MTDDDAYEAPLSSRLFSQRVAEIAPELAALLAEHMEDNFQEMLPHLYFGDVSRWVEAEVAKPEPALELFRLLDLLESTYPSADEYVQNLIDVSFVEMVEDNPAVVRLFDMHLLSRVQPHYRP